jgi:anaerobic magnesium-protoporphyrin IX monomethyl ester cyclase
MPALTDIRLHLPIRPSPAGPRRKVVLYNPQSVFFTMPLSLLAIGSALDRRYFDVVIVDARLEEEPERALLRAAEGALCVGMTVLTGAPIRDAVRMTKSLKARHPGLPIVWGGWHPSLFGRACVEQAPVDVTVQGQGEETFAEIVARLDDGRSLDGCAGCTYRAADGSVVQNPERTFRNLNSFPRQDYGLLPVERYFELKGKRQLDYISSQGCAFRCAFCADPFVYKRKWSGLEAPRMGEEIEELNRRYGFEDVNFQDETFFTYANRVEGVAEEFLSRGLRITWAGTMRADQGARLPDEVFAKCKASGLRRVIIGVESGSQEMMDRIKKDIKLEQVFESAEKCLRHDVAVNFPFIVGFPDESAESVQASLDVAKRLRSLSPKFVTPFFYFKPYPGTAITEDAVREGFRLPVDLDSWSEFDFVGSVGGPWVSKEMFRRIERFKYYQQIAWEAPDPWKRPWQKLAQWRLKRDFYSLPVEKFISERAHPPQKLS